MSRCHGLLRRHPIVQSVEAAIGCRWRQGPAPSATASGPLLLRQPGGPPPPKRAPPQRNHDHLNSPRSTPTVCWPDRRHALAVFGWPSPMCGRATLLELSVPLRAVRLCATAPSTGPSAVIRSVVRWGGATVLALALHLTTRYIGGLLSLHDKQTLRADAALNYAASPEPSPARCLATRGHQHPHSG